MEIERKFWVKSPPKEIEQLSPVYITQGYIVASPGVHEVRLRSKTKESSTQYILTIKSEGEIERQEYETIISKEQFDLLWPATEGRRIIKNRFLIEKGTHRIELDQYHEKLAGLWVAEVEFNTKEQADTYMPEPWMDKDISHLNFMKNKALFEIEYGKQLLKLLKKCESRVELNNRKSFILPQF